MVLENIEKKQHRTVIPERSETRRKVTPATKSAYFLEAVSRLWHRKGNPHTTCSLAEWKRGRLEFREATLIGFLEEWQRRGATLKFEERSLQVFGQVLIYIHEKEPPGLGRILRMKFLELTSSWK